MAWDNRNTNRHRRRYAILLAVALVVWGITFLLPRYCNVPRVVYANIVPALLLSMGIHPLAGAAFVTLVSVVVNNIGMSSGVILYALLTKVAEALLAGIVHYRRPCSLPRALVTALLLCLVIKPLNLLLYLVSMPSRLDGTSFPSAFATLYRSYLQRDLWSTCAVYFVSVLAAWLILNGIDRAFKATVDREKG